MLKDLTGQRFGRLLVVAPTNKRTKNRRVIFECVCDCGNTCYAVGQSLLSGAKQSCGCLQKELASNGNKTHGQTHSRLYGIWSGMKTRCNNENEKIYKRYGALGVTVCEEWNRFEPFYKWAMNNGYTDCLTLDRKDNNKGYSPDNCRWVTMKEQENNRRNNRLLTYNGETKTISQWANDTGIKYTTLYRRITNGWTAESALTTPVKE